MLCFQALLQTYIAQFYYAQIRLPSIDQFLSLFQSYATIIFTLTKAWIPQIVGNRQYVPSLKTKVWQSCLNFNLFNSLIVTLWTSGTTRNHYIQLFIVLLYAGMCSTLLLHTNCCKFFNPNRLKSCLLTLLFLAKFTSVSIFLCANVYTFYAKGYFDNDTLHPIEILGWCLQPLIMVCTDAFFVYIFGKSALKNHSISSIWNMDPDTISKPLFCTCIFPASLFTLYLLSFIIFGFMYQ